MNWIFCLITFSLTNLSHAVELVSEFRISNPQVERALERIVMNNNGRLKPFHTLSRESLLMIHGKWSFAGRNPVESYLLLMADPGAKEFSVIELRNLKIREMLGFNKGTRYASFVDLMNTDLISRAQSVHSKESMGGGRLTSEDQDLLELYSQVLLLGQILRGEHFMEALGFTEESDRAQVLQWITNLQGDLKFPDSEEFKNISIYILEKSQAQEVPEMFHHYKDKMNLEVTYNKLRPFALAGVLFFVISFLFLFPVPVLQRISIWGAWLPLLVLGVGLSVRTYITQFAPITNMYGTMIWVSLGVSFFAFVLFKLYKKKEIIIISNVAAGFVLLITEKIPLVLTPNMDPIVAVLRSNFWLTTHVITITVSYAAFTLAMVFGNIGLIRLWTHRDNQSFFKEYSHYVYRLIQLGCFLLTVGIILGGVWADYSWGRFWGWDPKETWALIADMGFLALLHARYIGWVTPFSLMAWTPIAYLLVIMAWYGVNFVLATGLHSYGFSSGGTYFVLFFVVFQIILSLLGWVKIKK